MAISAERLHQIRSQRYPDSKYASLKQCKFEAQRAELIYRQEGIPYVNSTNMSVEEIAIICKKRNWNGVCRKIILIFVILFSEKKSL